MNNRKDPINCTQIIDDNHKRDALILLVFKNPQLLFVAKNKYGNKDDIKSLNGDSHNNDDNMGTDLIVSDKKGK